MTLRFRHKLSIPSTTYALVERADLLERLDQAITTKQVVALAALAGWGKTTVLAQWAQRAAMPLTWYTLDSTDRDPLQFLDYLLFAVAERAPGAADLLHQLENPTLQSLPELFRKAALAIAAAPAPFALILDDYHVLEDESVPVLPGMELIFELLAKIAEYAPNCHLVLVSRMLPNLQGLARLTAQRRAMFFDYAMLQWRAEEIQQLVLKSGGEPITYEHAEQLAARMSGWVAGIVLALDQDVRQSDQPALDLVADISGVYAFFAEQIIAPLTPTVRRFLEDTSILEHLSPARCNALRGAHDSAAYLAEITRRGLFVSHKGGWVAYHSLFREFLRSRLAQDPMRERVLLINAAKLYGDEDDLERALDCYLLAGAEPQAIELLSQAIPRYRQRSRQNTLLACFERLSMFFERAGRGRILPSDLLLAQVRVYNDLALWDRAELSIRLAETAGDQQTRWEAAILYAENRILQGHIRQAQAALEQLPDDSLPPRLHLAYYLTTGRVQILASEIDKAIVALEAAYALTPSVTELADIPLQLASIADNLGLAYATQGNRAAALRYLKRADACWQATGNIGRRAMTLNNLGTLAMEQGHYLDARTAFQTGLELAHQAGRQREEAYLRYSIGELAIAEGQLAQAVAHFRDVYELAAHMGVADRIEAAAVSALWAAALLADHEGVAHWHQALHALDIIHRSDLRGRHALAEGLLLSRRSPSDLAALAGLAEQAATAEEALQIPERAYLALVRTAIRANQGGWSAAADPWAVFEMYAVSLPDALLRAFVSAHPRLFEQAAASSPLARRLVDTTRIPAQVRWHITTLGSFSFSADDSPCELSPLHRALLVRLLDAGESGLTVERLWEEVWGDTDIRMSALHKALARIREQTGLPMAARAGHCSIQAPWDAIGYDVRAFERALGAARSREELEHALALYRGDFLPGATPSAALWIDRRRSLLQQRYLDALEQLAHLLEEDEPRQAIQHYQHILQIDGCREETATQLMRLAARQRNHALVSATYTQLEDALRTLGATPEPSTIALLHATTRTFSLERARPTP
jgi:ATP/maltotriose-dependent transcriptional regulator MalT/DNA-binding SARP family transcriptional activator